MARGKGEGAVYQRKSDKMWCVSVELPRGQDGKRRRRVIARKSKPEALAALREAQVELGAGRSTTRTQTVSEWFTYWITYVVPVSGTRPKTISGYRSAITQHIIPALGKTKLDALTPADVRALDLRITTTPKRVSDRLLDPADLDEDTQYLTGSYSKSIFNVLRIGLNAAVSEGVITRNPLAHADPPRAKPALRRGLTLEQAIKLIRHVSESPGRQHEAAMWATFLFTGARRGEVLGLEIERVTDELDLSWQLQRISNIKDASRDYEYRHLRNKLYLTRPKSEQGWRIIPLVEPLASYLRRHIGDRTEGLVFTDADGQAWNPDRITAAWTDLLAELKFPDDIVLHGARRTTITLLYAAGVHPQVIREIAGHSTLDMTQHYRDRGDRAQLTSAMESFSALFTPPPSSALTQ